MAFFGGYTALKLLKTVRRYKNRYHVLNQLSLHPPQVSTITPNNPDLDCPFPSHFAPLSARIEDRIYNPNLARLHALSLSAPHYHFQQANLSELPYYVTLLWFYSGSHSQ